MFYSNDEQARYMIMLFCVWYLVYSKQKGANQDSQYSRKEQTYSCCSGRTNLAISYNLAFIQFISYADLTLLPYRPSSASALPSSISIGSSPKFLHSQHLQLLLHFTPELKHSQYFFKQLDFLQLQIFSDSSNSKGALYFFSISPWFSHPVHLHDSVHFLAKCKICYLV